MQVVLDVPFKYELRRTCKALSSALADRCTRILLRRSQLLSRGPRREVHDALNAFPSARRVVLSLKRDASMPWASDRSNEASLSDLLADSLLAMGSRRILSLALLHIPCPAPAPSALSAQRESIEELELSDDLYASALEQGAVNLLVGPLNVVARGDAMVRLAVSLPNLRRLSLASAAFSAEHIESLGSLTKLESLSVVGGMVCNGGAAQAAATHRSLLAALPRLQQLRLPMALAACDSPSALLDEDIRLGEYDDNADLEEWEEDEEMGQGGEVGGTATGGSSTGASGTAPVPSSATSVRRTLFGTDAGIMSAQPHLAVGGAAGAGAAVWPGPSPLWPILTGGGGAAGGIGLPQQQQRKRRQPRTKLTSGFVFPPNLVDLTIPLCVLNRPVFEAACAAYARTGGIQSASPPAQAASGVAGTGSGIRGRALPWGHPLARPAGAAAASGVGAAASGAVARAELLAGWGFKPAGFAIPAAVRQTNTWSQDIAGTLVNPLASDTAAAAAAAYDAAPALCTPAPGVDGAAATAAASSSEAGRRLRSLHIPTLAGYSHWEGSFLTDPADFERLGRLAGLEVLHLSLELSAFRSRNGEAMRACFQHLLGLRDLKELRVTEAQQPVCYTTRKRPYSTRGAGPFRASLVPDSGPSLDSCCLAQLQRQWPQLRSLAFFSETVVRVGDRLDVPGLASAELLPRACACCSEPHLNITPPKSRGGRWGTGPSALA